MLIILRHSDVITQTDLPPPNPGCYNLMCGGWTQADITATHTAGLLSQLVSPGCQCPPSQPRVAALGGGGGEHWRGPMR